MHGDLVFAKTDLVELIKQRDREGFNLLYRQFAHIIFGMSLKIVRDTGVAEDLVQETFVKVWKNIEQYNPDKAAFSTWLLNIARYSTIDYLRSKQYKQRQKNQNGLDSEYTSAVPSTGFNPELSGIKNLVSKLEPKYRNIIDLIYFQGYTQEEVSRILEIPLGTVKTRTRFALQLLKTRI